MNYLFIDSISLHDPIECEMKKDGQQIEFHLVIIIVSLTFEQHISD